MQVAADCRDCRHRAPVAPAGSRVSDPVARVNETTGSAEVSSFRRSCEAELKEGRSRS